MLILKCPKELSRYAVVGVATNVFGFLLYVLFTTLGISPVLYISMSYPIHIGLAFYLNKKWSFTHEGRIAASAARYLIAYIGCYVLNVAALKYFYGYWGFSHVLVQAVAVVVFAPLLFLTQKFLVFREDAVSIPRTQTT